VESIQLTAVKRTPPEVELSTGFPIEIPVEISTVQSTVSLPGSQSGSSVPPGLYGKEGAARTLTIPENAKKKRNERNKSLCFENVCLNDTSIYSGILPYVHKEVFNSIV
jgi:hypothetical protein